MSEYYGENRVQMITGKDGEFREVDASASRLMGRRRGGAVPPPPYTVRIQVQRLNPQAIQSQNELIMNAYTSRLADAREGLKATRFQASVPTIRVSRRRPDSRSRFRCCSGF